MRRLRIAVAWLLVGAPLAWGVARTIEKSLPLFRGAGPSSPAAGTNTPGALPPGR